MVVLLSILKEWWLERRETVSYVVVLGFGGSVKGLLGSIGVDGIYGWLEHRLFLLLR
jgi:hypothetical protein